ncbi:hypothetical protein T06_6346 [Trichinella sp. T6]|nr:hypothetical protein T06_6346 [Trichinella sp. T6]
MIVIVPSLSWYCCGIASNCDQFCRSTAGFRIFPQTCGIANVLTWSLHAGWPDPSTGHSRKSTFPSRRSGPAMPLTVTRPTFSYGPARLSASARFFLSTSLLIRCRRGNWRPHSCCAHRPPTAEIQLVRLQLSKIQELLQVDLAAKL